MCSLRPEACDCAHTRKIVSTPHFTPPLLFTLRKEFAIRQPFRRAVDPSPMSNLVGTRVKLHGLSSRPELNGRQGKVLSFDAERGRAHVAVHMEPKPLSLKPANLEALTARAAMAALPPHLRLGITLQGMLYLYTTLPRDAVDQVNKANESKGFPTNDAINGYVNQFFVTNEAKADRLGVCERLEERFAARRRGDSSSRGSSARRSSRCSTRSPSSSSSTTSTRRAPSSGCATTSSARPTSRRISSTSATASRRSATPRPPRAVDKPTALGRSYCLKEAVATQSSGAKFDVVMSEAQQAAFEKALGDGAGVGFDSIQAAISAVDVRTAECRNAEDQAAIRSELEAIGASACNALVVGLMREQLARWRAPRSRRCRRRSGRRR